MKTNQLPQEVNVRISLVNDFHRNIQSVVGREVDGGGVETLVQIQLLGSDASISVFHDMGASCEVIGVRGPFLNLHPTTTLFMNSESQSHTLYSTDQKKIENVQLMSRIITVLYCCLIVSLFKLCVSLQNRKNARLTR